MRNTALRQTVTLSVAGLIGCMAAMPVRSADRSLTDLETENRELKVAYGRLSEDNKQLATAIAEVTKSLADLRANFASTASDLETSKRLSGELKLRLEALGIGVGSASGSAVEQRLLTALSVLETMAKEKNKITEALVRLSEVASIFAKTTAGIAPEVRLSLEAEVRHANATLGVPTSQSVEANAMPSTLIDGMAISIKDELSLVVINLGRLQGVKVGMPFRVLRGEHLVGTVQVVDAREKISGAVVQFLSSEKDRVKVGDRLRVDAQKTNL